MKKLSLKKKLLLGLLLLPWELLFCQTWQNLTPELNASFMDLALVDENTCYAVGLRGAVYNTTDGGSSWNQVNIGCSENVTSVYTINGVVYATTESGKIIRSSDGASWSSFAIPEYFGNNIHFINSYTGFVTGGKKGAFAKTTNGGSSWELVTSNYKGMIRKVQFFSETDGFAIGQDYNKQSNTSVSDILKTTDGGLTWSKLHTENGLILNDFCFTDITHGYFVGLNGKILKTTNGTSFSNSTSGTTKTLNSVCFTDQYVGYAVGLNGTILKTYNGGASWQMLTSPKEYHFVSCDFRGATGYLLMAGNLILKTSSGGIN